MKGKCELHFIDGLNIKIEILEICDMSHSCGKTLNIGGPLSPDFTIVASLFYIDRDLKIASED